MRSLRPVTDRPITSSRGREPGGANPPARRIELKVDSHPATLAPVRKAIETFATDNGFDEKSVAEIGLVVNEAMANVIRHAYASQPGRPIAVEAELVPPAEAAGVTAANGETVALRIRLRDWGNGVDPRVAPKRGYVPGEPGGLGLVCLRQLMDHVDFAPQPDGGVLMTMIKSARRGESR